MPNTSYKKYRDILHNRYILYIIFFIALGNLLSFAYVNDYYSVSIFVLLAFLTTFFSKNMIVILFVATVFSNLIRYGTRKLHIEGFTDSDNTDSEVIDDLDITESISTTITESPKKTTEPPKKTTEPPKKTTETPKKTTEAPKKTTESPKKTTESPKKTTESPKKTEKRDEPSKEKTDKSNMSIEHDNKEKFGQDKDVVYTSDDSKELDETDKIIISQERILSSINKYKPLLDTLNGLTKNMSDVKGVSSFFSSSDE